MRGVSAWEKVIQMQCFKVFSCEQCVIEILIILRAGMQRMQRPPPSRRMLRETALEMEWFKSHIWWHKRCLGKCYIKELYVCPMQSWSLFQFLACCSQRSQRTPQRDEVGAKVGCTGKFSDIWSAVALWVDMCSSICAKRETSCLRRVKLRSGRWSALGKIPEGAEPPASKRIDGVWGCSRVWDTDTDDRTWIWKVSHAHQRSMLQERLSRAVSVWAWMPPREGAVALQWEVPPRCRVRFCLASKIILKAARHTIENSRIHSLFNSNMKV